MNYYNENDPDCVAWLKQLIKDGLIPKGDVDDRSIADVQPDDLRGFTQCHFFAGIGGWSEALRLAGWTEDRPVWTGSCPCQSFSCAGKGQGAADPRHLWPHFYRLIRQCRPQFVFGEQVEAAIAHGWLDGVSADLEKENYAIGSVVLGAHSVGAPHWRQRLYWCAVANTTCVANSNGGIESGQGGERKMQIRGRCLSGSVADSHGRGLRTDRRTPQEPGHPQLSGQGDLGNAFESGLEGHSGDGGDRNQPGRNGSDATGSATETGAPNFWSDAIWHHCRDGKARRIPPQPALFPLASRLQGRVVFLRGTGNSIVPQVAAKFIKVVNGLNHRKNYPKSYP